MTHVESDALQAEVERLRAENAKLARRVAWRASLRRASGWLLAVLGCGLAVLSLVAVWLRVTMLDTDRYVETVAPLAADPAVQDAVAVRIENAIYSRVDFASLARQVLPAQADVLAPAIQRGAQSVISDRIREFTRSERFQELWVDANRRAHTRVVELLEGGRSKRLVLDGDTVYLDLSAAVERVRTGLQERGLDRIAAAIPTTVDGRVVLLKSQGLVEAQQGVRLLKAVAIVLPLLALACLIGSVFLARSRRRGVLRAVVGLVVAMVLLIAALAVARTAYLDALPASILSKDAAASIFDTLVAFLRYGVRIVVVVAIVVALVTFVAGLPLRALATRGWNAFATSGRRLWVARHERTLMIAAGALGVFALLAWSPLTGGVVLIVLLAVGATVGTVYALSRPIH